MAIIYPDIDSVGWGDDVNANFRELNQNDTDIKAIIGTETMGTTVTTLKGAIKEVKGIADSNTTQLNQKVNKTDIVNNLTTETSGAPLDALQGKILNDKISAIRFFSAVVDPSGQNNVNIVLPDIKSSSPILAINGDYTAAVEYVVGIKVNDGSLVVYLNAARTGSMRISGIYSI